MKGVVPRKSSELQHDFDELVLRFHETSGCLREIPSKALQDLNGWTEQKVTALRREADQMLSLPKARLLEIYCRGESALRSACACGELGEPEELAVLSFLNSKNKHDHVVAAWLIEYGKMDLPAALPALLSLLTADLWVLRCHAAKALGHFSQNHDLIIPALIEALSDRDPSIRSAAADSLGQFGEKAKAAVSVLEELLRKDATVQPNAALALGKIGVEGSLIFIQLLEVLRTGTLDQKEEAASILGKMGVQASGAIPTLKAAMGEVVNVGRLGEEMKNAIELIERAISEAREQSKK